MLLIDEIYGLQFKSGFHAQLAVETAPDGRLRLKAVSAKIRDDLKSSLEPLNQPQLPVAPEI